MVRRFIPKSVEELIHWYERYISPLSLIVGFLADNFFLLRRVDLLRSNLLLFSYLAISALCIALLNAIEAGRWKTRRALSIAPFLPVVVQFCFGGLFSGYLSLYSRSASVAISWIFVAGLAALLLGNERFRRFYTRFSFQLPLYFFVLLSFLTFFVPVVVKHIGPVVFWTSGALSLIGIALFLYAMSYIAPAIFREHEKRTVSAIISIYAIYIVLYFTNIIPPLPLALKSAGVYHSVMKMTDGSYQILGERLPWYEDFLNYAPVYHRAPGEPIFVWSAIFAPSNLSTDVLHQWQRYDQVRGQWLTETVVQFPISGGRDGGFRGYSEKATVQAGKWRVNVLTGYGQLIGRISFTVVDASSTPPLVAIAP